MWESSGWIHRVGSTKSWMAVTQVGLGFILLALTKWLRKVISVAPIKQLSGWIRPCYSNRLKNGRKIQKMLIVSGTSHEEVIQMNESTIQTQQNSVHQLRKNLCCVCKAERYVKKLEMAKRISHFCFGYVYSKYWNLVIVLNQVNLWENCLAQKLTSEFFNVGQLVTVILNVAIVASKILHMATNHHNAECNMEWVCPLTGGVLDNPKSSIPSNAPLATVSLLWGKCCAHKWRLGDWPVSIQSSTPWRTPSLWKVNSVNLGLVMSSLT